MKYSLALIAKPYNGKIGIYLRAIIKSVPCYKFTGYKISPEQWDKETSRIVKHPNAKHLNFDLQNQLNNVSNYLIVEESKDKIITLEFIRRYFRGKASQSFSEYAEELLIAQAKQSNKYSSETIRTWESELIKLNRFNSNLTFEDFDIKTLRKFETWLLEKGNENNTVHKAFKFLKKVFNAAIAEGLTNHYPFRSYDNPKYDQPDPVYLTIDECNKIEALIKGDYDMPIKYVAAHFLLGCYSGLRVSDWIRFDAKKHIEGKRLFIRAQKNGSRISFEVTKKLSVILGYIKGLPQLNYDRHEFNRWLKVVASLCHINKNLTSHVARHSFATRCAEIGISKNICAEVLGITEKTCSVYYTITNIAVDREMKRFDF